MRFDDFENLRVAILGFGREGHAVWRELRKRFPDKPLAIYTESAIDGPFAEELVEGRDHHVLGPLNKAPLQAYDVLVRSAGISPYRY
jgi:UDP-N-acetylmuramoylalanine--D-glutamate ligase